jgi:cell division protein FtsI/penicillin-binding protein 2
VVTNPLEDAGTTPALRAMFERRLKVFLGVLLVFTAVLLARAAMVQVVEHGEWSKRAVDSMKRYSYVETSRGEILDVRGRRIAIDVPCVDACIDYRALTAEPDSKWVGEQARARLVLQYGPEYDRLPRAQRKPLYDQAVKDVLDDVAKMWGRLAKITDKPLAELEEARHSIVEKVRMRRRSVWYRNYELAMKKYTKAGDATTKPAAVWKKWLLDDGEDAPDVDSFELSVSEETEKHVILRDVEKNVQTELGKYIDRFPGLELRPSTHRVYPYGEAACHVLGRVTKVKSEDVTDKTNPLSDPLRRYEPNDLIGRGGLEGLAEPVLRGSRGQIDWYEGKEVGSQKQVQGRDVKTSI